MSQKVIFLFSFLIVVFIIANIQQLFADKDHQMLTDAETKRSIQTKSPGKIKNIKLSEKAGNEIYMIDLQVQNRGYALQVDAYSEGDFAFNKSEIPLKMGLSRKSVNTDFLDRPIFHQSPLITK